MKQTAGRLLTIVAAVAISAGVAGYTSYKLMNRSQNDSSAYNELFKQNPSSLQLAAYSANLQPVDLTQAAEASVHAVVHIRSKQLSRTQTVQAAPDFFDFFFDLFNADHFFHCGNSLIDGCYLCAGLVHLYGEGLRFKHFNDRFFRLFRNNRCK